MRHLAFPLLLAVCSPALAAPPAAQPGDALSRQLAAIAARKEPLSLADFAAKNVAPETNAVPVFRKAWESLTFSPEEQDLIPDVRSLPLTGSQREICDAVLKSNAETLALLARAAKLPNVDWQFPLDNPTLETFTNLPYGKMRKLANFARAAALRAHEQANDSAALAKLLLDTSILPGLDRSQLLFYRALADRRMAGIALTLHRYSRTHQNTLPEKLQTLLDDKLLAKIPDDPFAEKPTPIGYLPTADRPRLYSVSENGVDDGGSLAQPHPSIPLRRFLCADLPFFLTRPITLQPPPPPPDPPAARLPPPP